MTLPGNWLMGLKAEDLDLEELPLGADDVSKESVASADVELLESTDVFNIPNIITISRNILVEFGPMASKARNTY